MEGSESPNRTISLIAESAAQQSHPLLSSTKTVLKAPVTTTTSDVVMSEGGATVEPINYTNDETFNEFLSQLEMLPFPASNPTTGKYSNYPYLSFRCSDPTIIEAMVYQHISVFGDGHCVLRAFELALQRNEIKGNMTYYRQAILDQLDQYLEQKSLPPLANYRARNWQPESLLPKEKDFLRETVISLKNDMDFGIMANDVNRVKWIPAEGIEALAIKFNVQIALVEWIKARAIGTDDNRGDWILRLLNGTNNPAEAAAGEICAIQLLGPKPADPTAPLLIIRLETDHAGIYVPSKDASQYTAWAIQSKEKSRVIQNQILDTKIPIKTPEKIQVK